MNNQINQDTEHLKILSICHYVLAGLCLFPMLYGLFYMVMGIFFGAMIASSAPRDGGPPAALFGGIFIFIGLIIAVIALTVGILLFKAGRNLSSHQSYTFCFVIACISCVFMPFGTVLGIFTIIVLLRDSVKGLFNGQNFSEYGNQPSNWQ
jgi:uncharacterized membrane protein YhaH (DUF805 family)